MFSAILTSQLSWPLFESISVEVRYPYPYISIYVTHLALVYRSQITHIHSLFVLVHTGKKDMVPPATGMVWKVNEDLQKLPLSNKAAYRRALMEMLSLLKDTVKEFTSYVEEAERLYDGEEDVEDDASRDSDDKPYTAEEAATARDCLLLMQCAMDTIKLCLSTSTTLLDKIPVTDADAVYGWEWMARLHRQCQSVQDVVTELGAELFVPFDATAIHSKYCAGKICMEEVVKTLVDERVLRSNADSALEITKVTGKNAETLQASRILQQSSASL